MGRRNYCRIEPAAAAQRIGVINQPLVRAGDGLEASVRMRGKTWNQTEIPHSFFFFRTRIRT